MTHTPPPEESNWIKKFEEKFCYVNGNLIKGNLSAIGLKSFISTLLASELDRERSKILAALPKETDNDEQLSDSDLHRGYHDGFSGAIQRIKAIINSRPTSNLK